MVSEPYAPEINEQLVMCSNVEGLRDEMQRFVHALSFDYFSVVGVVDGPEGPTFHDLAVEIPRQYQDTYADIDLGKDDPVMQHMKHCWSPVWWDEAFYTSHNRLDRWETMASCGMRSGAALALHMPKGRHLIVGMDQKRETLPSLFKRQEALASLTLLATYLAEPALALLGATYEPLPELTRQELECLKWRGEGKSAWETGAILNLSESRISKVCAAASKKLGCVTTSQAALKALRLGLFS